MTFPDTATETDWLLDLRDHFNHAWKESATSSHPHKSRIAGLERSIAMALEELIHIRNNER
jgi:hypothetical protein